MISHTESDVERKFEVLEVLISWSAQKIVKVVINDDHAAEIITIWLDLAVARLYIDSHGNHVVQRVLQRLTHPHAKFIFDAISNAVADVKVNCFGLIW